MFDQVGVAGIHWRLNTGCDAYRSAMVEKRFEHEHSESGMAQIHFIVDCFEVFRTFGRIAYKTSFQVMRGPGFAGVFDDEISTSALLKLFALVKLIEGVHAESRVKYQNLIS